MLLKRLKAETAELHQEVEALAFADKILSHALSLGEYKRLLSVNYRFHASLEPQLENVLDLKEAALLKVEERRKQPLLLKDMAMIGMGIPSLADPSFRVCHSAQALGVLYVMEGATLGGAVILKSLKNNSAFSEITHFYYYGCYGKQTAHHWTSFCEALVALADTDSKQDQVVQSARAAFQFYKSLLKD